VIYNLFGRHYPGSLRACRSSLIYVEMVDSSVILSIYLFVYTPVTRRQLG